MEEKNKNIVPDFIIKMYEKKHAQYPCITQTRNVTQVGIETLLKKNKLAWSNKYYDGQTRFIREGLIDYSTNYKIMIYINEKEKVYKLFILSTTESEMNVDLLIKGLNKYFTIDMI